MVRVTEDFFNRSSLQAEEGGDAFALALAEDWMCEISGGFFPAQPRLFCKCLPGLRGSVRD
jgi:hypothetical protein